MNGIEEINAPANQEAVPEKKKALDVAKHDQDSFKVVQLDDSRTNGVTQGGNAVTDAVDQEAEANEDASSQGSSQSKMLENLDPWPHPVDMECIADEMARLIKKHCVLTETEVDAIVLWLIASYLINSFRVFPKLTLISPERRCGKTTTMEVIQALSMEGLLVSNLTPNPGRHAIRVSG